MSRCKMKRPVILKYPSCLENLRLPNRLIREILNNVRYL